MLVTIHKRATWARFVSEEYEPGHAAGEPRPMNDYGWNPVAGVFIHYRGPDYPWTGEYNTEDDCRQDIAGVYVKHWKDAGQYELDIAYNFLVCPHGNVYEGRGYQRTAANAGAAGTVDGYLRNTNFYSICGLLRQGEVATEPMLRSIRALIHHLRVEAPVKTGNRIVPHSHNYGTECPGNLSVYAQPGSTIDPAAPWSGFADIHLYNAQKWVNAAYRNVSGYIKCPESRVIAC